MRYLLFLLVILIFAQVTLSAQESQPAPTANCPSIKIECPIDQPSPNADSPVTVTALVTGADPQAKLIFGWTISNGTILEGQGTSTITVGGLGGSITATFEVQGLPQYCSNTASCSVRWCPIVSRLFDSYGNTEEEDEMARLDYLAIELENDPGATGYLIAYAGRRAHVNEALARLERAKDYLVNSRGISEERVMIVDGGYREELTVDLFITPVGAIPPSASPTVEPADVQIIKNTPSRTKRGTRRN